MRILCTNAVNENEDKQEVQVRPIQKSLELCLHLWDRNRSASGIWSQKPADVSGRCLPASLATLLPARQSDIIQNVQLPFVRIPVLITQTGRWNSSKKKHQPNFWTGSPVGILAFPFRMRSFLVIQATAGWGSLECCLKQKHPLMFWPDLKVATTTVGDLSFINIHSNHPISSPMNAFPMLLQPDLQTLLSHDILLFGVMNIPALFQFLRSRRLSSENEKKRGLWKGKFPVDWNIHAKYF